MTTHAGNSGGQSPGTSSTPAYLSTEPADIRMALQDIRELSLQAEPDSARIRRSLLMLRALFEDLSVNAQKVVDRLDQGPGLPPSEARRLIEYGKRLIYELQQESERISTMILEIEAAGFERLLQAIDKNTLRETLDTPGGGAADCHWQSQWQLFRRWFISQPDSPSSSQILRDCAVASISSLLRNIRNARDDRMHRIDRTTDFLVLAQWFAEAASDEEAHRLWLAAFGLNSARHLTIDDASLQDHESRNISPDSSWADAPPLKISNESRKYSVQSAVGALSRIIDRSAEKEKLAVSSRDEAERLLSTQRRFCDNGRTRLSEIPFLQNNELDLLLDLLGEAMSARVDPTEPVEVLFADGCLRIKLEPTGENRQATIRTSEGMFRGPDHWISIERIPTPEVSEVLL